MATPINTPLTSEIWHLSIDDLLQPLPESPRLGGSGPFVINLSASTAPISQPMKSLADFPSAHVYQIQRTEDRRLRYRLRLGPFGTEDEAEAVLSQVRDIYPSALTATAEMDDLRAIGTLQAKAEAQQQVAAAKSSKASASKSGGGAGSLPAESNVASASPPAATPAPLAAAPAAPRQSPKPTLAPPPAPTTAATVAAAPTAKPVAPPTLKIAPAAPTLAQPASIPVQPAPAQAPPAPPEVQTAHVQPATPAPVMWIPPTLSIAVDPPVLRRPVSTFQQPAAISLSLVDAFPAAPKAPVAAPKMSVPAISHPASIPITHATSSIPVLSDSVEVVRRPIVPVRAEPPIVEMEFTPAAPVVVLAPIVAPTRVVPAAALHKATIPALPVAAPAAAASPPAAVVPASPAAIVVPVEQRPVAAPLPPPIAPVAATSAAVAPAVPTAPKAAAVQTPAKPVPAIPQKKAVISPKRVQEIVPPASVSAATAAPVRKPFSAAPAAAAKPAGSAALKPAPVVPSPAAPASAIPLAAARRVEALNTPLPNLESTQTLRPLTPLELRDDSSTSRWFVIQLSVSEESFDPDSLPNLDIFNEYRLYCVAGIDQGKIMHALRVGFFAEEAAAAAVASYLGAFYEKPSIKRISLAERDRFADQRVEARKDIGATGRHAVIEITNERVIREKRTAPTVAPLAARPAAVTQAARKGK